MGGSNSFLKNQPIHCCPLLKIPSSPASSSTEGSSEDFHLHALNFLALKVTPCNNLSCASATTGSKRSLSQMKSLRHSWNCCSVQREAEAITSLPKDGILDNLRCPFYIGEPLNLGTPMAPSERYLCSSQTLVTLSSPQLWEVRKHH